MSSSLVCPLAVAVAVAAALVVGALAYETSPAASKTMFVAPGPALVSLAHPQTPTVPPPPVIHLYFGH